MAEIKKINIDDEFYEAAKGFDNPELSEFELLNQITEYAERGSTRAMVALVQLYSGFEVAYFYGVCDFEVDASLQSLDMADYWAKRAEDSFSDITDGYTLLRFHKEKGLENPQTLIRALKIAQKMMTLNDEHGEMHERAREFLGRNIDAVREAIETLLRHTGPVANSEASNAKIYELSPGNPP